jgi:hypothetical protein
LPTKWIWVLKIFLLLYFEYHQIWPNFLMDDCHLSNIMIVLQKHMQLYYHGKFNISMSNNYLVFEIFIFKKKIIFFHKIFFFEKQISWRTPTFLKIMILASTCQVDKHIMIFVFWNCNKLKLYLIYERHKYYPIFLYHGFTNLIQDVFILVLFTWLQIFEEFVET